MNRFVMLFLTALTLAGCAAKHGTGFNPQPTATTTDATLLGSTNPGRPTNQKSQQEMDEERHRLDGLRAYLRRSYPALHLESKDQLWEAGVAFVTGLGADLNSPGGAAKLEDTLSSLIATPQDASPSRWLCQATLRSTASGPAETVAYGIVTLTRTHEALAMVADPGNLKFNFHGSSGAGHLRGQLDFVTKAATFSGKAQGELLPNQISLHAQARINGKPVQGTFILLR